LSSFVTRFAFLSASSMVACGTEGPTAPSWLPSAASFLVTGGKLSWSRRRRCSVGTEKPDGASGERGEGNEARDGQR
jgi:hypothetical protein